MTCPYVDTNPPVALRMSTLAFLFQLSNENTYPLQLDARKTAGENQIYLRVTSLFLGKKWGFWASNACEVTCVSDCHHLEIPKKSRPENGREHWINGGAEATGFEPTLSTPGYC